MAIKILLADDYSLIAKGIKIRLKISQILLIFSLNFFTFLK